MPVLRTEMMLCNIVFIFATVLSCFRFALFTFFSPSSTGAVSARNIMLLKKKQARCQGVVCAMKVSDALAFKFHLKIKCCSEKWCYK